MNSRSRLSRAPPTIRALDGPAACTRHLVPRDDYTPARNRPLGPNVLYKLLDDPSFGWSSSLYKTFGPKGRLRAGVFYNDMSTRVFANGKAQVLQNGDS